MAAAAVAIAWACVTGPGENPDGRDPLRLEIARSEVDNVLAPTFTTFAAAADDLKATTAAWSDAIATGGDAAAARDAAQASYRTAVLVWQRAEVMQVGPAGSSAYVIAGEGLRDEIYSWPTVNACRIDEELVAGSYGDPAWFQSALVNVKGLDAIEYLLFNDSSAHACDVTSPIEVEGTWSALGDDEVQARRAAYAAGAAAAVASVASELAEDWKAGAGQVAVWATTPGEADSPYETPTSFLDDLLGATFYVESAIKHSKLAATTTAELESPYAQLSKEHVVANLEGVRMLVQGGPAGTDGTGFDDFLVDVGEAELADELLAAIDASIEATQAVPGSFADALADDPAALAAALAEVSDLVDLLAGPVATALRLRRPGEAAGDAD